MVKEESVNPRVKESELAMRKFQYFSLLLVMGIVLSGCPMPQQPVQLTPKQQWAVAMEGYMTTVTTIKILYREDKLSDEQLDEAIVISDLTYDALLLWWSALAENIEPAAAIANFRECIADLNKIREKGESNSG